VPSQPDLHRKKLGTDSIDRAILIIFNIFIRNIL